MCYIAERVGHAHQTGLYGLASLEGNSIPSQSGGLYTNFVLTVEHNVLNHHLLQRLSPPVLEDTEHPLCM
jgi:hypothetical protein